MKKKLLLFLVAGVVFMSAACVDSEQQNEKRDEVPGEVTVNVYDKKPDSLNDKHTILLSGVMEGDEYIEAVVTGEVFDFEHVALIWDEDKNDVVEQEVIKKYDKLRDQIIVIKTYQPEGIPSEKIKWKNAKGEISEYIIAQKNLKE